MSNLHVRGRARFGALLLLLTLPLAAATVSSEDPSALPSEIMPRAAKSLLLDLTRTANAFYAVGERGHVLRSADGRNWVQLNLPTRSALTSIATADGQLWVAGHDGVILHSADAGQSWKAQRRDPYRLAKGELARDHDPRQGAPILDIYFSDASNGIAIGAYSLMLLTHDGGATWTPEQAIAPAAQRATAAPMKGDVFSQEDLQLDEEADPHLNSVISAGPGTMVIVGERGTCLRSNNGGKSWQRLAFPYKGSMFGVLSLGDGRLLAYGLRGNVYQSTDLGSSWSKVATQGSVSLMGGVALDNGGVALAGANGTILYRPSLDAPFVATTFKNANGETPALAGILPAGKGNFVLVGDKGADLTHLQ